MTIAGLVLALWTTTSAASTLMSATTRAFDREDRRGFVRKRLLALGIVLALGFGAALVLSLLVFGPHVERWVGGATGVPTLVACRGGRSSGHCSSPASSSRSPSRSRSAPTSTSGAGNS